MQYELQVRIQRPEFCELMQTKIPIVYRKEKLALQWYVRTDELSTPAGLPIVFDVELGTRNRIAVESRDNTLLRYHFSTPEHALFELLLPTDEMLDVTISRYIE